MTNKPVIVNYSASDFLGGTILLDPWEELAFRRICDLIYATGDNVPDDARLAKLTKVGSRWKRVREKLIELGKIEAVEGRLTQKRCKNELKMAQKRIENASAAGKASAKKRTAKQYENKETESTPVERELHARSTTDGFYVPTNHEPLTMIEERKTPSESKESLLDVSEHQNPADKPPATPNGTAQPATKRGTRLPDAWVPTDSGAFGIDLGLTLGRIQTELDKFRDYWRAQPGAKGVKLDWDATFRNWLRKASESPAWQHKQKPTAPRI